MANSAPATTKLQSLTVVGLANLLANVIASANLTVSGSLANIVGNLVVGGNSVFASSVLISNLVSTGTATPANLSLGGTFGTSSGLTKLKLYDTGVGEGYGLGVTSGKLEYIVDSASASHVFYINAINKLLISNTEMRVNSAVTLNVGPIIATTINASSTIQSGAAIQAVFSNAVHVITIGDNGFGSGWGVFSTDPALGAGNFALATSLSGGTIINAATNKNVALRINNSTQFTINTTVCTITPALSSITVNGLATFLTANVVVGAGNVVIQQTGAITSNGALTINALSTFLAANVVVGAGNVVIQQTGAFFSNGAMNINSTGQFTHIGANIAPHANAAAIFKGQYFSPLNDKANTTATMTINWNDGNEQYANVNASTTFTFSNPVDGGRYVLLLKCGTSLNATWPANVLWPSNTAPTLTATAGHYDLFTFIYLATPDKYLGSFNQNYF